MHIILKAWSIWNISEKKKTVRILPHSPHSACWAHCPRVFSSEQEMLLLSWTTRYKTHINHNLSSRKNSCMGHGGEIHLCEISRSFVCVRPFPGTPGSCDCGGHGEMTSSPWHVTQFWQYHLVFLHTPPLSLSFCAFQRIPFLSRQLPRESSQMPLRILMNGRWPRAVSVSRTKLQINVHPLRPRCGIYPLIYSQR